MPQRADRAVKKNSLSVIVYCTSIIEYVLEGRANGGVLSVIFIFLMRSR